MPLNLIQPDENEPSRLLGTCELCARWAFLVELEPDWRKVLLIELPDDQTLRQQSANAVDAPGDPAAP